ncbi:MAG: SpoIIE family protein phosphatase [Opitutaceae bacterium]|nr:SpoIIE family protein phosphatase [Opitutaceae bacterium]
MKSNESPSHAPSAASIRFSLRFKILLALTIFNTLAIAVFTVDRWSAEKQRIMEGLRHRLDTSARALPEMLPDGYLDRANTPAAIAETEYRPLVNKLSDFCNATGIRYLYTYTRHDGAFFCTSSNGTPEELKTDTHTRYWDRYDTAPAALFEAWDTNTGVYKEVSDTWGRSYTLFLPLTTKSGSRFIAGSDLPIDFVEAILTQSLRRTLSIGGCSFPLFFAISFWASTRFCRHIRWLATYTHELSDSNFEARPDSPLSRKIHLLPATRADEIGQLASSFLSMEARLLSYLRELTETTAAKERIQGELRIAGEIQASMLPQEYSAPSDRKRVDVFASMKPAKEAGGDLYDLIHLDDDHLLFVIADVSDKGMPAALFTAAAVTILRARATVQMVDTPEILLAQINEQLIRQNSMYQFVTTFLGVLDLTTGLVTYADGGHNRPYHRPLGQPARMLPRGGGIALGVMPEAVFTRHTVQLKPGETLFLYTDGVTEAIAANDSFYGEPRLETLLTRMAPDATAHQWVTAVTEDVATFSKGHFQADDITVLSIRYLG